MHVSTEDNFHTYSYTREDLGRAISLVLEFAHHNADILSDMRAFKDRGEAIALTFDDATDCGEPWDLEDISHSLTRTVI